MKWQMIWSMDKTVSDLPPWIQFAPISTLPPSTSRVWVRPPHLNKSEFSPSEQNPIFIYPQPSVCFLVVRGDAEEASCIKSKLTSGQPPALEVSQPFLLMFLGGSRQRWDQLYLLLQLSRRTSSRPNPSEWINMLFKLLVQPGGSWQHWDLSTLRPAIPTSTMYHIVPPIAYVRIHLNFLSTWTIIEALQ